ncbi:MAG: HAD-IA family hydrolase [Acidimicrobiales bacterium]
MVRQVAAEGSRVCCFSNTNSLHWDGVARIKDLMSLFDTTFLSFQMGMLKPDREAFEHVAKTLGLHPGGVLFLDDNQMNVDAARAVGFSATRVVGVDQARQALIDAAVIDS